MVAGGLVGVLMNKRAEGCWWGSYFPFALSPALCPITGLEARRRRRSRGHLGLLRSPAVVYLELPGLGAGLGTLFAYIKLYDGTSRNGTRESFFVSSLSKSQGRFTELSSTLNVSKLYEITAKQFTHVSGLLLPVLACITAIYGVFAPAKMALPHGFSATPLP
jgi:hypothetical protein